MSIKEISAKEAKKEYQKAIDADNENKLKQIYSLIREACVSECSITINETLINNTVSDKLLDLGYDVEEIPSDHPGTFVNYVISWGKADV